MYRLTLIIALTWIYTVPLTAEAQRARINGRWTGTVNIAEDTCQLAQSGFPQSVPVDYLLHYKKEHDQLQLTSLQRHWEKSGNKIARRHYAVTATDWLTAQDQICSDTFTWEFKRPRKRSVRAAASRMISCSDGQMCFYSYKGRLKRKGRK